MRNDNHDDLGLLIRRIFKIFAPTIFFFALGLPLFFTKGKDISILVFLMSFIFFIVNSKEWLKKKKKKVRAKKQKELLDEIDKILNIDRKVLANKIAEQIAEKGKNIHVIVGSSGAGKSKLVKEYLSKCYKEHLPKEPSQIILNDYLSLEDKLLEELSIEHNKIDEDDVIQTLIQISEDYSLVLVFDQFESLFLLDEDNAKKQLEFLCELFKFLISSEVKCILVIRKEWYFNLKFFEEFIPPIKDVYVIDGIDENNEFEAWETVEPKVRQFVEDSELAIKFFRDCQRIRTPESYYITSCCELLKEKENNSGSTSTTYLLPVELTTCVESLAIKYKIERKKFKVKNYDKNGGKQGVIKNYFEYYLSESGEEEDAARVLYTLSVAPRSRRSLKVDDIIKLTNLPRERVINVLDYFSKKKKEHLIENDGFYDWKHDYYAERFNEISGTLLDPIDRDNINYFWTQKDRMPDIIDETPNNFNEWFGLSLFIFSFLLLLLRTFNPIIKELLNPIINFENIFQPLFTVKNFQIKNFDLSFLPITISLTLWSWYVTTLFRRLLSQVRERKWPSLFSHFVAIWSLICVVLSIMFPKYWISLMGIGGIVIGLKYRQLTRGSKRILRINRLWIETFLNSSFATILGLFYVSLFPPSSILVNPTGNTLALISFTLMIIMIYFALLCIKNHIGRSKYPALLGMFKRSENIKKMV